MFTGLSQKVLEKLHKIESKITGNKLVPHNKIVGEARKEMEQIFEGEGRINPKYAKEVLIAFTYSQNVHHYLTENTLIKDIRANKRIVFNNYK